MINLGKPSIRNGRFCPIVWAKWAFQLFYNTNVTWPYSRYRNIYKYVFLGVFYRNRHHWWVFFSCLWTLKLPAGDWPQGGYQTTNLEELIWHNYIIQFCLDRNYRIMAVKMSYNSLFLVIHSISMGLVQYKHNWYNSGHNCRMCLIRLIDHSTDRVTGVAKRLIAKSPFSRWSHELKWELQLLTT